MGERTSYEPGTFCWADLGTTDQEGGKAFYTEVFGWEAEDQPVAPGMTYTMLRLDGRDAAALSAQQPAEREQGVPPHWHSYVSVVDVEEVAGRVPGLGGTLIAPPFDVMDVGRMAILGDPTGAVVCLWEPRAHFGAGIVNVPGALCWNELATSDPETAKRFYGELLGWSFEDDGSGYAIIRNGDRNNGGIRRQSEQEAGIPPNWLVYFAVSDVDGSARRAEGAGGRTLLPGTDLPIGRIAVLADPQGAAFCLFAGQLEP